jgi:Domain of unknown function (DUF3846)
MALHIKSDGMISEVHPPTGRQYNLAELQAFVGGRIELVVLEDGRDLYLNEEGLLIGLPFNASASQLAGIYLVGDVIVGSKDELGY